MHMTITDDFSALGLSEQMLTAVRAKGFETPTAIQKLTIPHLLTKTNDIIAQSQTGTGKTAAYGLPILQSLEPARGPVQAIILVPTRELALQAAEELPGPRYFPMVFAFAGDSTMTRLDAFAINVPPMSGALLPRRPPCLCSP